MKIIVAGLPKTGTKSMQAALIELGYEVYDFIENYSCLGKEWNRICSIGGSTEDFRRMYKDVDAVTDMPPCFFWYEIHKAFPNSKIILTVRDNEDVWMKSFNQQMQEISQFRMMLLRSLSPTMSNMFNQTVNVYNAVIGTKPNFSLFYPFSWNEMLVRKAYRHHNAYVIQCAPKEKLLVYNVKEGWEPLCDFLGVEVPDKPFPKKNISGEIVNDALKNNPGVLRCKRELMVSSLLLAMLFGLGGYLLLKKLLFLQIRTNLE